MSRFFTASGEIAFIGSPHPPRLSIIINFIFINQKYKSDKVELSTGQNFKSPQEILKFPAEVEGDVTQEVEAMAEEGLEGSLQSFLKGTGEFSS